MWVWNNLLDWQKLVVLVLVAALALLVAEYILGGKKRHQARRVATKARPSHHETPGKYFVMSPVPSDAEILAASKKEQELDASGLSPEAQFQLLLGGRRST